MKKGLVNIKGRLRKFAVFDIETYDWVNPYALGFYDGENYYEFLGKTCVYDFLKFVIKKKYRGYTIYAHNGGKFDFNFLADELKDMGFKIHLIPQGSRCLLLKVYTHIKKDENGNIKHSHTIKFSDSIALLKFSLDKLTKDFNVKHQKINFMDKKTDERDYDYLYRLYKEKDKRFNDYLKNDVFGLYEVLVKFEKLVEKNNGIRGLTIASTALKTFQKGYLNTKIKMCNKQLNNEMKLGYYGGRTEIFRMFLNEGKYRCYDVNSLYPYVMFNNKFPISPPKTIHNPSKKIIHEKLGITKCRVEAPKDLYYPVLPYKKNIDGHNKLIFPLGKFKGYWDNHLLRKAMELGYKITPLKTMCFNSEYIFKDYVNDFYRLKQRSKRGTPSYIIAKLLLNSLYGKFAQSQESEKLVKIITAEDMEKYEIADVFDKDYNIYKVKCESKGNFFIPQISIHVTALAQLRMYEFIEKLDKKGYIVSYCDTDSLFTDGRLPTSNKLGDMKKEYDFIKGYFLNPKTYCIIKKEGNKVKAKGYTREFQKQLTENSFKKALFKNDFSDFNMQTKEKRPNPMKSSFIRHKKYVSTDIIKKSMKTRYNKRIILKDYNTKPLII
jgi:hypothetical protein